MATRLQSLWLRSKYSFWFLPTVMVVAAVALAFITERVDRVLDDGATNSVYWVYGGSADGAREMLATIAGSTITVAGVVFSITLAALSLASQQFGPRLLRNFIRDRGNQFVLGTFIATFVYCLLVLRQVRGGEDAYVPGVSIGIAIAMALVSLGVLIYFIHHVASTIQANSIIASVGEDLEKTIDRMFPDVIGAKGDDADLDSGLLERITADGASILAQRSGYIEAVQDDSLMRLAIERDIVIQLQRRPGHYVVKDAEFAIVMPGSKVHDELRREIDGVLLVADNRTVEQDVEFAIEQIVEVAVRALSTGINDPFTAKVCVDRLTSAMVRVMGRAMPKERRYDDNGAVRVIAPAVSFDGLMDASFNAIRQYGRTSPVVMIRLLECMAVLQEHAHTREQRRSILRHAEMIARAGREAFSEPNDVADLESRWRRFAGAAHGSVV